MGRIFDHVDLRVGDLAASSPFYRSFLPHLGFTIRVDIPGWLQFEAAGSGATEFFGVTEDRDHTPNRTRIAFWAESRHQVDVLAAGLAHMGARNIEGPGYESETYYAVYFDDPSGNALEICYRSERFNADQPPV
ncbi:glyoxalase [Opitutaceae bacterium TAV5]|nr:glyoxalase [Opitutaceae bacterium TAV5]